MTATVPWDANTYHQVSNPHVRWGANVLDRVSLKGSETVLDAGCGTGRVTEMLLERLPFGRVIALDADEGMLTVAKEKLVTKYKGRVDFVQANLLQLPSLPAIDVAFSTATFHWISDHRSLFSALFGVLKSGGKLVAQCGGYGNLDCFHAATHSVMQSAEFEPHFQGFQPSWYFATPEHTSNVLSDCGFVEIETGLQPEPTVFSSLSEFRTFASRVVLREYLGWLETDELREQFLDQVTMFCEASKTPRTLDYVRLNLLATKP